MKALAGQEAARAGTTEEREDFRAPSGPRLPRRRPPCRPATGLFVALFVDVSWAARTDRGRVGQTDPIEVVREAFPAHHVVAKSWLRAGGVKGLKPEAFREANP